MDKIPILIYFNEFFMVYISDFIYPKKHLNKLEKKKQKSKSFVKLREVGKGGFEHFIKKCHQISPLFNNCYFLGQSVFLLQWTGKIIISPAKK